MIDWARAGRVVRGLGPVVSGEQLALCRPSKRPQRRFVDDPELTRPDRFEATGIERSRGSAGEPDEFP